MRQHWQECEQDVLVCKNSAGSMSGLKTKDEFEVFDSKLKKKLHPRLLSFKKEFCSTIHGFAVLSVRPSFLCASQFFSKQ